MQLYAALGGDELKYCDEAIQVISSVVLNNLIWSPKSIHDYSASSKKLKKSGEAFSTYYST